jgi:hypothetical protein
LKVEVKAATDALTENSLNRRITDANKQIRNADQTVRQRGDIVIEASAAPPGLTSAQVERRLRGKMRDGPKPRLTSIDYLEVVYRDAADGMLKRTFVVRTVDDVVPGPVTETFPEQR